MKGWSMRPRLEAKDGRRKLEPGFPSLEGDQNLPCGWWDSTLPLEYSKETLPYHFLLFPEMFGVQLREIVRCDCYHQTAQSAWMVHCILRISSHFNAMNLVQTYQALPCTWFYYIWRGGFALASGKKYPNLKYI